MSSGDGAQATLCVLQPIKCCGVNIRTGTYLIAYFELILIFMNIVFKAVGYLETAWNWELLFLVVDSVAVLSLLYGIWRLRAPFLQPFVVLNLMTNSLLVLGTIFFISAAMDQKSYAGEYVEMELRESAQHIAKMLHVEQKFVVRIVGGFTALIIGLSTVSHLWFFKVIVQCAQYFRDLEKVTAPSRSSISPIAMSEKQGSV